MAVYAQDIEYLTNVTTSTGGMSPGRRRACVHVCVYKYIGTMDMPVLSRTHPEVTAQSTGRVFTLSLQPWTTIEPE